jgi:hypothetical protein
MITSNRLLQLWKFVSHVNIERNFVSSVTRKMKAKEGNYLSVEGQLEKLYILKSYHVSTSSFSSMICLVCLCGWLSKTVCGPSIDRV